MCTGCQPIIRQLVACAAIKELSSVAGLCAARGCALIRQLANFHIIDIFVARLAELIVQLCVCVLTRLAQIITAAQSLVMHTSTDQL